MTNTINDYLGRTVDVVAFQGTRIRGDVLMDQSLAREGESGSVNTGIVKLGQRFLLELLTERGSMRHRPGRGSSFMIEIRSQRIRTATELQAALSRGLIDVRRNLSQEETDDDPLDEKFGLASIVNVELSDGNARVFIAVQSQDPDVAAVLPIDVSIA